MKKPSYASQLPHIPSPAMHPPPSAPAGVVMIESSTFPQPYYLHTPQHHQQPYPAPPRTGPVLYSKPEQQGIKTIFVSGLPEDVKPREIHNLFRRRPGFDFCQLEYTGRADQVVAFATFLNHQSAIAAISALDGVVFDPETGATLHIELARSNSRKRSRGDGAYVVIDKRVKLANDDRDASSDDGNGGSDEPSENDDPSGKDALAAQKSGRTSIKSDNADATTNLYEIKFEVNNSQPHLKLIETQKTISSALYRGPLSNYVVQKSDLLPCSTLFIANLGPTCTKEELKQVLSKYSGFQTLKMRAKGGMPVAFADFTDTESSTAALNGLQDVSLESSDRGGMHVEYARSKMRNS